ncbi:MAG: hypothetical protein K0S21_363 [Rhizobiaceae bacterium]|jgi:hypothetical protein|nr:hypothetical protein [Rhizobiaceae bacterium]
MKQPGSIQLFQYWNRLRNGRVAPKRTEIEPADIKALLPDTFILEKDTRREAVFRLAGTRLCSVYGRELKGFSFPSLWREQDQRLVARLAEGVFRAKSVAAIAFEGCSRSRRLLAFEMLLLPLDGGVENPRSLGIMSALAKPFWMGADPLGDGRIQSVRVVDPDREPLFLKNRAATTVPGILPGRSPTSETTLLTPGARRIRHLVVLDGGRQG